MNSYSRLICVFFLFLATSLRADELRVNDLPPRFNYFDSDGNFVDLQRLSGEYPIVLSFFTTYCQPCKKELPFLRNHSKNETLYRLVLVNSENAPETKLRSFLRSIGVTHPVVADRDEQIAKKFLIEKFPYTLYIGKSGKIIRIETGFQDGYAADLIKTLTQLQDL